MYNFLFVPHVCTTITVDTQYSRLYLSDRLRINSVIVKCRSALLKSYIHGNRHSIIFVDNIFYLTSVTFGVLLPFV